MTAAVACGISRDCVYEWLRLAREDPESKYADAIQQWEQAEARSEMALVGQLADAAKSDWKATESFLQRRFPENWGNKQTTRVEQTTKVTATVSIVEQLQNHGVIDAVTQILEGELANPTPTPELDSPTLALPEAIDVDAEP